MRVKRITTKDIIVLRQINTPPPIWITNNLELIIKNGAKPK